MKSERVVIPEFLDHLAPESPEAEGSRRDLLRVNTLMLQPNIMARALRGLPFSRIADIGAGDGRFMLKVAKKMASIHPGAKITLLDQSIIPSPERVADFRKLGWDCEEVRRDAFEFLEDERGGTFDLIVANLFLHHFENDRLAPLLKLVSQRTRFFVACEPRRSLLALNGAKMLWAIGCNNVTIHDARVSVLGGFKGAELSSLWPTDAKWSLEEGAAPPFTHFFKAVSD